MTDTKRLRELAEAATPGEWRWRFSCVEQISDGGQGYRLDFYSDCETVQESQCHECGTRIGLSDANGEYIAAANPRTVLALLDEVERLRVEVSRDINADFWSAYDHARDDVEHLHKQLAVMTRARNEACDIGQRHTRALRAIMPKADRIVADDERIAELRKAGKP